MDAGIAVAMKSDHPIINAQHLVYHAAMAHHYGLTELQAMASVTSVPAKAMGLEHRIGKIAVGMDADLVIWQKHPLSLGAHPLQVYIDGIAQIKNVDPEEWPEQGEPLKFKESPELVVPKAKDACSKDAKDAVFTGIKKIIREEGEEVSPKGELVVVVRNGEVVCSGLCRRYSNKDVPVYDLGGEGVVLPSLLSVGTNFLGLLEIPLEQTTGDGTLNLLPVMINAADGLKFGGHHMDEAYKSGVLVGVTAPLSEHVVQGVSVAFSTGAEDGMYLSLVCCIFFIISQPRKLTLTVAFFLLLFICSNSIGGRERGVEGTGRTACQDQPGLEITPLPHDLVPDAFPPLVPPQGPLRCLQHQRRIRPGRTRQSPPGCGSLQPRRDYPGCSDQGRARETGRQYPFGPPGCDRSLDCCRVPSQRKR